MSEKNRERQGQRWEVWEEELLTEKFHAGYSLEQLSVLMRRKEGSVRARLNNRAWIYRKQQPDGGYAYIINHRKTDRKHGLYTYRTDFPDSIIRITYDQHRKRHDQEAARPQAVEPSEDWDDYDPLPGSPSTLQEYRDRGWSLNEMIGKRLVRLKPDTPNAPPEPWIPDQKDWPLYYHIGARSKRVIMHAMPQGPGKHLNFDGRKKLRGLIEEQLRTPQIPPPTAEDEDVIREALAHGKVVKPINPTSSLFESNTKLCTPYPAAYGKIKLYEGTLDNPGKFVAECTLGELYERGMVEMPCFDLADMVAPKFPTPDSITIRPFSLKPEENEVAVNFKEEVSRRIAANGLEGIRKWTFHMTHSEMAEALVYHVNWGMPGPVPDEVAEKLRAKVKKSLTWWGGQTGWKLREEMLTVGTDDGTAYTVHYSDMDINTLGLTLDGLGANDIKTTEQSAQQSEDKNMSINREIRVEIKDEAESIPVARGIRMDTATPEQLLAELRAIEGQLEKLNDSAATGSKYINQQMDKLVKMRKVFMAQLDTHADPEPKPKAKARKKVPPAPTT